MKKLIVLLFLMCLSLDLFGVENSPSDGASNCLDIDDSGRHILFKSYEFTDGRNVDNEDNTGSEGQDSGER